jgi:hypothetical protein
MSALDRRPRRSRGCNAFAPLVEMKRVLGISWLSRENEAIAKGIETALGVTAERPRRNSRGATPRAEAGRACRLESALHGRVKPRFRSRFVP